MVKYYCGNVIYEKKWQFWLVTVMQFLSVVLILVGVQNLIANFKEGHQLLVVE